MSDPAAPHHIFAFGQDAILIRFGGARGADPVTALRRAEELRAAALPGVTEIASSLASVQVRFAPEAINRAALTAGIETLLAAPPPKTAAPTCLWTIPACFDGPQLSEVVALAGLIPATAIADLTQTELSVLAIGFAPGQPYLGFLPPAWGFERQARLTPQVPTGALVVALRQLVLFANPSPTGWRWVGRCAFRPFVAERARPFALRAGDRIRFAATDSATLDALDNAPDGLGGAQCAGPLP